VTSFQRDLQSDAANGEAVKSEMGIQPKNKNKIKIKNKIKNK
jgi:hypothetical protein